MSTFSTEALLEKLSRLSLSQDSIETLSLWIIQHKAHSKDSVRIWLEEVKKASADRRLVLFYLANDILQNGRRKGADLFLELFQDPLRQAVTWIGGQKIQTSIERMFRIWKERRVYSNAFLKELELLIEPVRKSQVNESLPDFKLQLLQDALSEFAKFEAELKVKSSHLSNLRVDISNPTTSLSMLKDKSAGGRVSQEFEEACQRLQDYCECLGIEVNERINIVDMLKECKVFTTYRLAELERTVKDYKTLSESVVDLKEKIDQRVKDLERAHSTATSDPSAEVDITDVGDMEIESDGENQEPQPKLPSSTLSAGPGMIEAPPVSSYPVAQQDPRFSQAASSLNPRPPHFLQSTPPTSSGGIRFGPVSLPTVSQGPRYSQPAPPSSAAASAYQQQVSQDGIRPRPMVGQFPARRPPPTRPPPPAAGRGNPRPRSVVPLQRLPPPRMPPRGPFQRPPIGARGPPPILARGPQGPPMRGLGPAQRPQGAPVVNNYSSMAPSGSTAAAGLGEPPRAAGPVVSSSPVLYSKPSEEKTVEPAQANHAATNSKPSLDDRLKDMLLQKKLGLVVEDEEESDLKPYSPSAEEHVMGADTGDMEEEEDKHSLPTPSSDSPADPDADPDISPSPNMDNPIIKALYQASPDINPAHSLVPDYDQDDDNEELSSTDLKNILDKVISSEPTPDEEETIEPSPAPHPPAPVPAGSAAKPKLPPAEIKITPTLTTLLDEIFPKISRSLIDRKRKQDDGVSTEPSKVARHADMAPVPARPPLPPMGPSAVPRLPPSPHQQQRPHFLPRSPRPRPMGRPGIPIPPNAMRPPLPPGPPPPKQPDMSPRPFSPYTRVPPPGSIPYNNYRFGGPGPMQPPIRSYQEPRMMYRGGMPPGFRPTRPPRFV